MRPVQSRPGESRTGRDGVSSASSMVGVKAQAANTERGVYEE